MIILRGLVMMAFIGLMLTACTTPDENLTRPVYIEVPTARIIPDDLLDCRVGQIPRGLDPDSLTDRDVQTILLSYRRENILCYNDVQAIKALQEQETPLTGVGP